MRCSIFIASALAVILSAATAAPADTTNTTSTSASVIPTATTTVNSTSSAAVTGTATATTTSTTSPTDSPTLVDNSTLWDISDSYIEPKCKECIFPAFQLASHACLKESIPPSKNSTTPAEHLACFDSLAKREHWHASCILPKDSPCSGADATIFRWFVENETKAFRAAGVTPATGEEKKTSGANGLAGASNKVMSAAAVIAVAVAGFMI
ncbi:hypothetical protein BGW39_004161 [Mortierella sp. 14UC]|nr:hypothetical protein BGW39_004161 [Mortierella sp. 14UC]